MSWRILCRGVAKRKPSRHYSVLVDFSAAVSKENARDILDFMRSRWPSYDMLLTNREDWNRCFNSHDPAR